MRARTLTSHPSVVGGTGISACTLLPSASRAATQMTHRPEGQAGPRSARSREGPPPPPQIDGRPPYRSAFPLHVDVVGPLTMTSVKFANNPSRLRGGGRARAERRPGFVAALPRGGLIGERARAEPRGERLGQPRRSLEHYPPRADELVERDATEVPLDQRLGFDRHDEVFE